MAAKKDVTQLLERLEAFEDRLGVRLESLSAQLDADDDESMYLDVRGELHPKSGTELKQDMRLIVAVYDSASRVVATEGWSFSTSDFWGFEVFHICVKLDVKDVTRVRIYPKPTQ